MFGRRWRRHVNAPDTGAERGPLRAHAHPPVTKFPVGVKYARVAFDRYQPWLTELGGGSGTFYEAVLCDVSPQPGSYDWSELDTVADQAESVGHELMLKVRVGSCWATGGQVGRPGRQGQDGVRDSDRHGPIRRVPAGLGRALRRGA